MLCLQREGGSEHPLVAHSAMGKQRPMDYSQRKRENMGDLIMEPRTDCLGSPRAGVASVSVRFASGGLR